MLGELRERRELRVSVLELPARWKGTADALREVDALLTAGPAETDLVVVPEQAFVGYVSAEADWNLAPFAEPIDGPTTRAVAEISRRHRVHLVAPLVLRERDCVYNAAVVVGPDGSVVASYRKRHPWLPERWATPGPTPPPLFTINDVKVTIAICYDGHFLESERDSAQILEEADLLVFTSAWVDEEDSRVPLLRSLARRFRISVANANWCRGIVEVPGQGGSCILDANGNVMAAAPLLLAASATRIDSVIS